MLLNLFESLSKFLTGLVTLLANAKGLTKAGRERLLLLVIMLAFFEIVMITDIALLWLFLKP